MDAITEAIRRKRGRVMTDLERIKKDVVEMDSRANVCWYDTKVLTKAVRLILEELTADRKTEPTISKMEQVDEPERNMAEDIVESFGFKAESYRQAKAKTEQTERSK